MGLSTDEKEEFFPFLESLANSTYNNFQYIKNTSNTDNILQKLRIRPNKYMQLIYNLTEDLSFRKGLNEKLRNTNNEDFIKVTQILTENGICYTTNSILAVNLSTSILIDGKDPAIDDDYVKKNKKIYTTRFINIFDGEMSYSFFGFVSAIIIYLHSPYEIMNVARSIVSTNDSLQFKAVSIDIVTTDQFRQDTSISQRGCRFHGESNLTHFKVYTKLLCNSECRIILAMRHCNCIPHFYPNLSKHFYYFIFVISIEGPLIIATNDKTF